MPTDKQMYIQKRVTQRKSLLGKIPKTFKSLHPEAIYQFGSGTQGFKDEFSDIDVWLVFKDQDIKNALSKLPMLFRNIAPVLIKHHSKSWSPVGGSANSVLHEINDDLYVVDYYISKSSETAIKKDAKILYGKDHFEKGEWRLQRHVDEKIKDTHTIKKDIDLFLNVICISFKGIVRNWKTDDFVKNLETIHKAFRERYPGKLPKRKIALTFTSNYQLLNDLHPIANSRQKKAIQKITAYGKQIQKLYFG